MASNSQLFRHISLNSPGKPSSLICHPIYRLDTEVNDTILFDAGNESILGF